MKVWDSVNEACSLEYAIDKYEKMLTKPVESNDNNLFYNFNYYNPILHGQYEYDYLVPNVNLEYYQEESILSNNPCSIDVINHTRDESFFGTNWDCFLSQDQIKGRNKSNIISLQHVLTSKETISLYYQNFRSIRNKISTFNKTSHLADHDIYCFTETWLNESYNDVELGFPKSYQIYRQDRNINNSLKKIGGGVLIAIKNKHKSKLITTNKINLETLFVQIKINGKTYLINCTYIPPSSPVRTYQDYVESVEEVINKYTIQPIIILTGDFNIYSFVDQPTLTDHSECLTSISLDYGLSQVNFNRNNTGNVLDLIFTDINNVVVKISDEPLVKIDSPHPPLEVTFESEQRNTLHNNQSTFYSDTEIFCYRKANFLGLSNFINNIEWGNILIKQHIEYATELFYEKIKNGIDLFVPKIKLYEHKFPIWMTQELKNLIIQKKVAHKKYKQLHSLEYYIHFQSLRRYCLITSERDFTAYNLEVESNLKENPRKFYQYINNKKVDRNLPPQFILGSEEADEPKDIANLFAKHFASVYSNELLASPKFSFEQCLTSKLSHIHISKIHITKKLRNLKSVASSGPDGIPPVILKNCAKSISTPLSILFNKSLNEGKFPISWKISFITPIYKSAGPKSDVQSFRPVSKLSAIPKAFEAILYDQLKPILTPIIIPKQHGFIQKRSVVTNLGTFTQHVSDTLNKGLQLDVAYTDYSKAFDKLNINIFCAKLEALGIGGPLLDWFYSFLSDRKQLVLVKCPQTDTDSNTNQNSNIKLGTYYSNEINVLSGCPQGGHLSGLFFDLYSLDIADYIPDSTSLDFWQYADDLKVGVVVGSAQDGAVLQEALNGLSQWSENNKMELNIGKCKIMSFHRKKNPIINNYYIHNQVLIREYCMKDLGVLYEPDLSFNIHIDNVKNKACKILGFIKRNSRDFRDPKTIYILYCSLVRPLLEYATTIWAPFYQNRISKLESVQRNFLRYLAFKNKEIIINHDYTEIHKKYNLRTLEQRRIMIDVIYLYKILNYLVDCPELLSQIPLRINTNNTRCKDIFRVSHTSTNIQKNTPINRMMRLGNFAAYEADIDFFADSLTIIKDKLNKYYE